MENFFRDINNQLRERISSPLLGSFLIAWLIWNYKAPLILLSEESVLSKISMLKDFVFPSFIEIAMYSFALPLASALAYIYLYPFPAKKVYQYALLKQREMAELRQKIEDETPLTREEYTKIRTAISIEKARFQSVIDQKDHEIEQLKEEISALAKSASEATKSASETTKAPQIRLKTIGTKPNRVITKGQHELLQFIAAQDGFSTMRKIVDNNKSNKIEIDYNLGELERLNYLQTTERNGTFGYSLTHEGKGYIVRSMENLKDDGEERGAP